MTVLSNKYLGHTVHVHVNTNTTLTIVGNSSSSSIALNNEVVVGAAVRRIWASVASGNVSILRGSNLIFASGTSTFQDYVSYGATLTQDPTATLVLQITGNGTLTVELAKQAQSN